ncbi:MAG TPA: DeoR/GlpR family DNA-binding transcription regulator [Acidocella sp.]|nr:DeoR/GlpR family DNA-binding transcription regulator [Acidocella sp.]
MSQLLIPRRHVDIMAIARQSGRVLVEELALHFAVTPQTIRRDLTELCNAGLLTRVHGGAIIASGVENLGYDARRLVAQTQKQLIGEAAARLISDHSSMFINIGTTTEEVGRALAEHTGLLVITNNLHVASLLYQAPGVDVIIAGGSVRRGDGGIMGEAAISLISQFRVDTAIIGTSAIDADGTLLDFDIREVQASRVIIENARRVILVTDCSKFSRSAPVRVAHLADIDILVTDRLPSAALAALCQTHNVEVIEVGGPEETDSATEEQ